MEYYKPLIATIIKRIDMRFEVQLHDIFLIIAAISHSLFKTAWIHDHDKKKTEAIKFFKDVKMLLLKCRLYMTTINHSILHRIN